MKKLIEHNLFGNGLLHLEEQLLIDRYNVCLKDIGIKQTKLTHFHIDKWGWSPEIAQEFGDKDYLSFGFANPYSIILSPEQEECSIYYPFHSFDWELMDTVFETYRDMIKDVTTKTALWFEMDQGVSNYRSAKDMLLIDSFRIKFHTPDNIIKSANEQKKLVQEFNDSSVGWADSSLHAKILDSVSKFGDLRHRNFDLKEFQFTKIKSFYSRVFEGIFILRNGNLTKTLLVHEANNSNISGETQHSHVEFNLNDPNLFIYLYNKKLINNDLSYYKGDFYTIQTLRDTVLIEQLAEHFPEEEINITSERHKNKYISMLANEQKLSDDFWALEEINNSIKKGKAENILKYSFDLQLALSYPNPKLPEEDKKVIWQILVKLSPIKDVVLQYLFDKNQFFADYVDWPDKKQDWAIEHIKKNKNQLFNYKLNKN
ncbi:MAG: DUF6638 family protein [Flavobacteriales bacterium]